METFFNITETFEFVDYFFIVVVLSEFVPSEFCYPEMEDLVIIQRNQSDI